MIENDSYGTPNKEIHLVRNPNWKASDADFRPAYLDDITIQEGFADTVSAGKKILTGERRGQRRLLGSAERDQAGGDRERPGPADRHSERRQPLHRAEHAEAAVRRHQRPQGGDRRLQPHGPAQHARRRARRAGGNALPAARTSPASRRPAGSRARASTYLANPNGDPAVSAAYFKKAGMSSGKCEGPDCEITMVGDDSPPGPTPRKCSRVSSRRWASR